LLALKEALNKEQPKLEPSPPTTKDPSTLDNKLLDPLVVSLTVNKDPPATDKEPCLELVSMKLLVTIVNAVSLPPKRKNVPVLSLPLVSDKTRKPTAVELPLKVLVAPKADLEVKLTELELDMPKDTETLMEMVMEMVMDTRSPMEPTQATMVAIKRLHECLLIEYLHVSM